MGEAVQELAALFHNGQVGGEVGVKDIVKADGLQGSHHTAGGCHLLRQIECLCPGNPDGGSHLNDGGDLGIGQILDDLSGIVPSRQCAGGAVGDALAAVDTVGILQIPVQAHIHGSTGAGASHIPDMHTLNLVTDLNTAHTLDALGVIPDNGGLEIHGLALQLGLIRLLMDIQSPCHGLQLAVAAADTGGALGAVLAQQQVHIGASCLTNPGGVGVNHHALQNLGVAGGNQTVGAFHFHNTHTAGGDLIDSLQEAQMGNGNPCLLRCLQNGCTLRHAQFAAINLEIYHFSTRPPLKIP